MTRKSRYFLIGASVLLLAGVGGGVIAYYAYKRQATAAAGLPAELRYVPADAEIVAYADVRTVVNSELRRELERVAREPREGRAEINDFAGIDVEKQVHHVVAYLQSLDGVEDGASGPPLALVMVQGTFEQARVEQFIQDHGGTIADYNGKHIATHQGRRRPGGAEPAQRDVEMAVGFVRPDLMAFGQASLVRRALDVPEQGTKDGDITSNEEMIRLIREASGGTAWAVGKFDAMSRRMGMPSSMRQQIPPLRLVSAVAQINGGMRATVKAETANDAAADQVRDVLRSFISLIRLQAGDKPDIQSALKTIELSGSGSTVQLSFAMSPQTLKAIVPHRREGPASPK
jgi:hypothetical protein